MFPIRDSIPTRNFPVVNTVLIVLNILIFIFVQPTGGTYEEATFFTNWGLVPHQYQEVPLTGWAYLPFLTNMFLHGNWLHLISNVWTLYIFGDNVEDRLGKGRYIIFYLLCGLAGSAAHFFTNLGSDVPAIGASGAISGVMGAYLLLCPKSRISMLIPIFYIPFFFKIPAWVYLAYWFLIQLASGTSALFEQPSGGGVAFWAHIGGFIAGIVFHKLFTRSDYQPPDQFQTYKKDPRTVYIQDRKMRWGD
jgi:membrane associated rhomboid family serine protease